MRFGILSICVLVGVVLSGCKHPGPESLPTWEQNKELALQNQQLKQEIAKVSSENAQLRQRIGTLSKIDPNTLGKDITTINSIELYRMTGIYLQNGKPELVVYLICRDDKSDAIKAAGKLDVQLWNLSSDSNALIQEWEIQPQQLATMWGSSLMSSFYRTPLGLAQNIDPSGDYIVRVTFTDYLTGKVLNAKKIYFRSVDAIGILYTGT